MQKLMLPVAALVLLAGAPLAAAADMTGMIKDINGPKDSITLDNGMALPLPKTVKITDFRIGEKVKVTYTDSQNRIDVSSVVPAG